jgi:hypothetical protein
MDSNVFVQSGPLKSAQSISVGLHVLRADEPKEVGGNDEGPTPYDLLLAGLGANHILKRGWSRPARQNPNPLAFLGVDHG